MFKTFSSAAIIASATATEDTLQFGATSLPEYLGGLIYGLTGNNDLDALKQCFDVTAEIEQQGKLVVQDFAEGHVIHAFEALGDFAGMLPPALTNCSDDVQVDLKTIEEWAQIWKQPLHLAERIGKNWLLQHFQIHHDMKLIVSDWHSEDYWGSGVATSDFLTQVLTKGMPVKAVPEFIAGFMYKFAGENNLDAITGCWNGGHDIVNTLESAIADFKHGGKVHITRGIVELKNVISMIKPELSNCKSIGDDIKAIEEWATIFTDKAKLIAHVTKNLALHHKQITGDIATLKADFADNKWFTAGEDAAELLAAAIGTVQLTEPEFSVDFLM